MRLVAAQTGAAPESILVHEHVLVDFAGAADLEIWTNTGLYAAGSHKYLPRYAFDEPALRLARRWANEAARGVGGVRRHRTGTVGWHRDCVANLAAKGLLGRILVSQDAGWYHVGEPGGGSYRGYTSLFTDFVPLLDPAWRRVLLWDNPRAAFG